MGARMSITAVLDRHERELRQMVVPLLNTRNYEAAQVALSALQQVVHAGDCVAEAGADELTIETPDVLPPGPVDPPGPVPARFA